MLPCPRCGGSTTHALSAVDRNRETSELQFEYRRCDVCGVLRLNNIPENLAAHYPADYHGFLAPDALAAKAAEEAPRIAMIKAHVTGGRMVEIGPSQGFFSLAAKNAGFDLTALEMDAACCAHLESVVGVRAINTAVPEDVLPTLEPSRAVVMWHVIEHVPDPWVVLKAIAASLEPGGVFVLATPNPESLQAKVFKARWVHVDAPRHVTLIPLPALTDEADQLGLELVGAVTSDPVGRELNRLGWARSVLNAPALRPDQHLATLFGWVAAGVLSPWEQRSLRGAAYTAVFRKRG